MDKPKPRNLDLPPMTAFKSLQDAEAYIRQLVRVIDQLSRRLAALERNNNCE